MTKDSVPKESVAERAPAGWMSTTATSLLANWAWEDLEEHGRSPSLIDALRTASAEEIKHVVDVTLRAFTFVSGGGWCPDWIEALDEGREDERFDGSGLLFLADALALLREVDEALWVSVATRALPYVVCDGEAIDHDEGEAWDLYGELSSQLAPHYRQVSDGTGPVDVETVLESLRRQLASIGTAHIRGDFLATTVALLESEIARTDKERAARQLFEMVADADVYRVRWARDCGGVDRAACDAYANRIAASDVGATRVGRLLVAVLREPDLEQVWKCGRATGSGPSDVYWPGIHRDQNDRCPIFHFDGQRVHELGTFSRVPKISCAGPDGLYFAQGTAIYRYGFDDQRFHREVDAGFQVAALGIVHGQVVAVGERGGLARKWFDEERGDARWDATTLDVDATLTSVTEGRDGEIVVAGTKGTILVIAVRGGSRVIPPVDEDRKNYRVFTGTDAVYLICTTGLYRLGTPRPKAIVKGKVTDAVAVGATIYASVDGAIACVEGRKEVERLPLRAAFLARAGDALVMSLDRRICVLDAADAALVTPAADASPSPHVVLPDA